MSEFYILNKLVCNEADSTEMTVENVIISPVGQTALADRKHLAEASTMKSLLACHNHRASVSKNISNTDEDGVKNIQCSQVE